MFSGLPHLFLGVSVYIPLCTHYVYIFTEVGLIESLHISDITKGGIGNDVGPESYVLDSNKHNIINIIINMRLIVYTDDIKYDAAVGAIVVPPLNKK